jgi:hypothetical protein
MANQLILHGFMNFVRFWIAKSKKNAGLGATLFVIPHPSTPFGLRGAGEALREGGTMMRDLGDWATNE